MAAGLWKPERLARSRLMAGNGHLRVAVSMSGRNAGTESMQPLGSTLSTPALPLT